MMRARPRGIVWLLAAVTLVPIGVLTGLGLRILQQDRDADRQRQRDALDVAARRVALDMARWVQDVEARLSRGEGVVLTPAGPISTPAQPVLYQAPLLTPDFNRVPALDAAEALEYRERNLAGAAEAYRTLARAQPALRPPALLALGGVLAGSGDLEGALATYAELSRLGGVEVASQPAALVARHARCRVLERADDRPRLLAEATGFARALYAGGWRIDRPTFENYHEDLQRWGAPAAPAGAIERTRAAIRLWQSWQARELAARGSRIIGDADAQPVLAIWTGGPDRVIAWFATSSELDTSFGPLAGPLGLRVVGLDDDGRRLFGDEGVTGGLSLVKSETRLPFVLSVAPIDLSAGEARDRTRRIVLVSGLAMAFVLMLAAAYGLYRTTTRELALARQQADFVSAVSHEFRTPLTSMRHLTDLLATRQVTSDERRAHYYDLLTHETERLNRMVEALLSFGRIEAGGYAWRLEPIDIGALVEGVVAEFRREPEARSREIVYDVEPQVPGIRADAEALSRALWNLLDNAAKYSAPDAPISVSVARVGQAVHVGVGDRGIGIRPEERESVFVKFVRGADARSAGIGGVGLGLALVSRIAEAHGGSVRVESEPGHGSTFTLVIPCAEAQA